MKKDNKHNIEHEKIRDTLASISEKYGFEELYTLKDSSNSNEEIQIKTTKKGIFKGPIPNAYMVILCNFINPIKLKTQTREAYNTRFKVENHYEGENWLLCNANSKIFAYDIKYYYIINKIIHELDYQITIEYKKFKIGVSKDGKLHMFIIETNVADFAIAGMKVDNLEEEERAILSNKLEASQPFFEFKAPIYFEWSDLVGDKGGQFERICELLLQKEINITSIIPIGKTRASDRGRDFEVIEKIESLDKKIEKKWLVQCKYSERSISPSSISGWTDRIIEHKYDGYWLMTNNDITPSLFDQFKDIEKNDDYHSDIRFWQRSDFHIKMNVHSELFQKKVFFKSKKDKSASNE